MSARTYVRPSREEFDEAVFGLVPDAEAAGTAPGRERVYDLPLPADELTIRVFSTIEGGEARDRGADAIRCVVWHHGRDVPVGGRVKTLRTPGWDDRLCEKVRSLYADWREHDHGACPECQRGVLVERRPSGSDDWDPFLACSEWDGGDGCEHTEPL